MKRTSANIKPEFYDDIVRILTNYETACEHEDHETVNDCCGDMYILLLDLQNYLDLMEED